MTSDEGKRVIGAVCVARGYSRDYFRAASPEERESLRRSLPDIDRQVEERLAAQLELAKDIVSS